MKARLFGLVALTVAAAACRQNRYGYEGLPSEAAPNVRLREGTESAVLARYFTTTDAVTSRVWGSASGVWAFTHLAFTFDDRLANVTPSGPELLFMSAELGPVTTRPAPPGVLPGDLPHVQVEAGASAEAEASDALANRRTGRFVMAADPAWLIVRHRPEGHDRLLRLPPGASTWSEEPLPPAVRELHLREAGPEVSLFELADGRPAMVREGQLVALDAPPAALGVPAGAPSWVGPFDGRAVRLFWATPDFQLCTGTWNLVELTGRRDGCLAFGVEGTRVVRAAGTVEETIVTVRDTEPLGGGRWLLLVATASGLTLKGEGGYGAEDAGLFVAWTGANPVLTEQECPLDPGFYGVSRHFDADGGFGLVRCPRTFLADTCTCDRTVDLKRCDCLQRSVENTRQFRAGRFTYLQAGWEQLDGRLLLRVHRYESDTSISTTADPIDALKPYTGPYSWTRPTSLFGLAPGYGGPASELVNLGRCATVTGPAGPVTKNADGAFLIDLRDRHTVELDCQPPDQGPPLERLTIDAAPMLDGGFDAWRLTGVQLVRGTGVDLPEGVITTINPAAPEMIASAADGTQRLLTWDGGIGVAALPPATGVPLVVPELRQAIFGDGQVLDLDTRTRLGTLPAGQLARDRQSWLGITGNVWALARGASPSSLGAFPQPEPPITASPVGIVVTRSSTGVWAVDANDRSRRALLYGPTAGPIQEASISADGRFIALLEQNVGGTSGSVRFYRREESSPALTYVETQLCQNCGQLMGFVTSTGDVLHLDGQTAGVFVYRPALGTSTQLTSHFPVTFATLLPVDAWGRVWFQHDFTFTAWDPATATTLSTTVSRASSDPASTMPVRHLDRTLFKGVTFGRRRYTVTASGLVLTFDGGPDPARAVRPLAGGRGWRSDALGSWVGRMTSNLLELEDAVHMDRGGTPQAVAGPEDAFMPCRLIQSGPQPDFVVSPGTLWKCQ
jgi:hypothetical protein